MDEVRVEEEEVINVPIFDVGDDVELMSGEFNGSAGKVGARQLVEGEWQYGIEGVVANDMYAVHEHEIQKSRVVPVADLLTSYAKGTYLTEEPVEEEDDVSSLLQKASQLAQGRELNSNQTLQGIMERLDRIDQRLETKEIKVVVEVEHRYPEQSIDKGPKQKPVGVIEDLNQYIANNEEQLNLFEEEE